MTTISVNGTDYPIKFGRMALIAIMKLTGAKGLSELSKLDSLSPEKWGDFVLAGLENGCKVEKIQSAYTTRGERRTRHQPAIVHGSNQCTRG
jgi:hypothetical protein